MDSDRQRLAAVKQVVGRLKPYLRWVILGGTLFFLVGALKAHWGEVAAIRVTAAGWGYLAIALGVTLLAHIWSGWVWGWILHTLGQSASGPWCTLTYLRTNIAKYLPGNVWHFYGRVMAAKSIGIPVEVSTVSVVMEALLMATSALLVAFVSNQQLNWVLQSLGLVVGLGVVHPRVLNPVMRQLSKAKSKVKGIGSTVSPETLASSESTRLHHYPVVPLLGELGFLGLRGAGFVIAMLALTPIGLDQIPLVLSAFSLAWMLGLVVPGAPGGIGVFEAIALALLSHEFSTGVLISVVALYRLISTLAEAMGAAIAWLIEQKTTWARR